MQWGEGKNGREGSNCTIWPYPRQNTFISDGVGLILMLLG